MENLNEGKKPKGYMAELAEIDAQSAIVAMEAKIGKLEEMAKAKEQRLEMVSEDENLSELISKSAVKEMQKEIKEIRKMQEKLKKVYEKKNGKMPKAKEVVDEEEKVDEGGYGIPSYEEDDTNVKEETNEEVNRWQKLAGIPLKEEVSPQIAADKAIKTLTTKLEKSPEMDKLAAQVAKNPKLMAQLEKSVKAAGVNVELAEDESGLDMGDLKTMALNLAKKSKSVNEKQEYLDDEDGSLDVGLGMASFVGGGSLGAAFGSAIVAAVPAVASIFAGPALLGAAAGVGLFLLAKKAYLADKNAGLY